MDFESIGGAGESELSLGSRSTERDRGWVLRKHSRRWKEGACGEGFRAWGRDDL